MVVDLSGFRWIGGHAIEGAWLGIETSGSMGLKDWSGLGIGISKQRRNKQPERRPCLGVDDTKLSVSEPQQPLC